MIISMQIKERKTAGNEKKRIKLHRMFKDDVIFLQTELA